MDPYSDYAAAMYKATAAAAAANPSNNNSYDSGVPVDATIYKRPMCDNSNTNSNYTNSKWENRSVHDFDTDEDLRRAMMVAPQGAVVSQEMEEMFAAIQDGQPVQKVSILQSSS